MYLYKPSILLVVFALLVFPNSDVFAQQVASPVELLARQPDFVAEEIFFSVEQLWPEGHVAGFEVSLKKAKKGKFYRTDTGATTIFEDATKPRGGLWFEGAEYAESFVKKEGIKFEPAGTEQVQGHECVKIRATKETAEAKPNEEEAVYFYVAKDLRNLVIATQVITPRRRSSYVLRNISFDVPADLFKDAPADTKQTSN